MVGRNPASGHPHAVRPEPQVYVWRVSVANGRAQLRLGLKPHPVPAQEGKDPACCTFEMSYAAGYISYTECIDLPILSMGQVLTPVRYNLTLQVSVKTRRAHALVVQVTYPSQIA